MNARPPDGVRLLRIAESGEAGVRRDAGTWRWRAAGGRAPALRITFALLAVGAVLVAIVSLYSGGKAIRAIPEQQRAALLSQTVGELQQFCGEGRPGALKDHCRELASFAAQFDECKDECVTLVRRELTPVPTR